MPWAKFDDQYPINDKMMDAGIDALGFDVCGVCYSNRYLTDGFIADHRLPAVYPPAKSPKKLADRLVEVGRWQRVEGGYKIHDFFVYNPSAEEVEEIRAKRAAAGRRGGANTQAKKRANRKASRSQDAEQVASQNGNPVSRIPVPEGEVSKSQTALAERLNAACQFPDLDESLRVVAMLAEHVDLKVIDEAVGWATQPDSPSAPKYPRYFLKVASDWGRQRGVDVPWLSLEETGS